MTSVPIRNAIFALFAAIWAAFSLPAYAQDTSDDAAVSQVDAHADLHAAIQSGLDQDTMLQNTLDSIEREYARIPDFIQLEASSPGFISAYVEALRPVFETSMARANAEMKANMINLFREEFTREEASEIAAHYRTDAMKRLLGNVSRSFSPDSTISNIEEGAPISQNQVDRDLTRAAVSGAVQLSADDRADIQKRMAESAALRKFEALTPKILEIRTAQENQPLRPDEEAQLMKLAEAFFAERFGN
uniref:DUF2059 domain-containing protein n=1 Tax=uncultured Erythrobacter sp. TaxID=263913 RepID=UPI0026251466|nr:DUF2059 domain-containing protein [uncultured Erythrobacter sp.]